MKIQGKMIPSKAHNNFPVNNPKDMKYHNLLDEEFKIALSGSSMSYKKTDKFLKISKNNTQNEIFNKETKIITKKL